jgi:hypothetical protein
MEIGMRIMVALATSAALLGLLASGSASATPAAVNLGSAAATLAPTTQVYYYCEQRCDNYGYCRRVCFNRSDYNYGSHYHPQSNYAPQQYYSAPSNYPPQPYYGPSGGY